MHSLNRKRSRAAVALGATIAVVAALTACASSDAAEAPASAGTLTFAFPVTPTSFSPQEAGTGYDLEWMQPVYDSLLRQMPDGTYEPFLASSWSYDDTETTLSIELVDDATFSDGTPVDAAAVKANIEATRDGTGPLTANLASVEDIEIVDDYSLALHLDAVDPDLLRTLAQTGGMIANPASLGDPELSATPDGSGPYVLDTERTVTGSQYVFTKRDDYWNDDLSLPYDEIVEMILTDQTAVLNALQSGQIEAAPIEAANVASAEAAGLNLVQFDAPGLVGIYFWDRAGQLSPAIGDVRVRQAIAHAIDKKALLEAVRAGLGSTIGQQFRPGWDSYVEDLDDRYDYDPDEAKKLLEEAGYADGLDVEMVRTLPEAELVGQYLADVGIRVTWLDTTSMVPDILSGRTPLDLFQLQSSNTWQVITTVVTPDAGWNVLKSEDPELDAMLDEVRALPVADRGPLYQKIDTWLVDNAWFAPLYTLKGNWATSSDVTIEPQQYAVPFIYDFQPAE